MKKASLLLIWLFTNLTLFSLANTGTWQSKVTGGIITFTATESQNPSMDVAGSYMTVVYLEKLGFEKLGGNSNAEDVAWLLAQGYRVIELNYENHPNAVSPKINEDIIAINKVLANGAFGDMSNCSSYRSYVLFEGYRIKRDVSYFKDDPTVYNKPDSYVEGDSLHMDIIYPANALESVPIVLSFSYSNSSAMSVGSRDQRVFLPYTFAGFNDSFLEGAPARGIAWAIADHPKYCPWGGGKPVGGPNDAYKSYQVNPDAAQKVKSAVRTLRALGDDLGLSGNIGIYGFSRGSDAGSMAVGDRMVASLENKGLYTEYSDDVQAAALGAGVFDFTQIYNSINDGDSNLETRCPWVWGNLEDNYALWESMGAAHLAETSASAPVLFWYNTSDSPYYLDQISHFKSRLDSLNVPTYTLVNYGSGHSVPQAADDLDVLYSFFDEYLEPPALSLVKMHSASMIILGQPLDGYTLPLTVSPNPVKDTLRVAFSTAYAGRVKIAFYDLSGQEIWSAENHYNSGYQVEMIVLNNINLSNGIHYVLVIANDTLGIKKFVKQ